MKQNHHVGCGTPAATHQETHEVESEHGGHASERQPLQHGAPDPSRVTVSFGLIVGRAVVLTAAGLDAAEHRHGNEERSEHAHCRILTRNLQKKLDEFSTGVTRTTGNIQNSNAAADLSKTGTVRTQDSQRSEPLDQNIRAWTVGT